MFPAMTSSCQSIICGLNSVGSYRVDHSSSAISQEKIDLWRYAVVVVASCRDDESESCCQLK